MSVESSGADGVGARTVGVDGAGAETVGVDGTGVDGGGAETAGVDGTGVDGAAAIAAQVTISTDFRDNPPRIGPLLAQYDTALEMLMMRLEGITDEEFLWSPGPRSSTVERRADGRGRPVTASDDAPSLRTIAWLVGHLGEMGFERADYTTGGHSLLPGSLDWPLTAAEGLRFLTEGQRRWRAAIGSLDADEVETVGRSQFPHGLDPYLPVLEIVWWMNRELIHHGAEIAVLRDLYAVGRT
jgi:hypothetical protein